MQKEMQDVTGKTGLWASLKNVQVYFFFEIKIKQNFYLSGRKAWCITTDYYVFSLCVKAYTTRVVIIIIKKVNKRI